MTENKKFDLRDFIESISSYPDCKLSIYCHGTNNLLNILEIWKDISTIYVYLSGLDKKIVFEGKFNRHYLDDTQQDFVAVKRYTDSHIATYESKYYIFIHANDICKNCGVLETTFKEKKTLLIPELKINTSTTNESTPSSYSSFMCYEAYGLIFKRLFYRHQYSDFGDDNTMYEISPNSKYSNMYGKPIIQIYINPAGHIETTIYNVDKFQLDKQQSVFNFSKLFYDNKSYVCINYDEIPNEGGYGFGKTNLATFNRKTFAPNVHNDCFIITQVGWTANGPT